MESASSPPTLVRRFQAFWVGPIDTRPLALMRVTFGMALVFAVLDVAPVLRDLLSEDGVMPRGVLLSGIARTARFSVFDVAGPVWVSALFFCATVFATCAFAIGFHTRAATIASFVLVTGLHERNLSVFDGSDNVIRILLFFLMFAPAGDHYSIDALRRPAEQRPAPEARSAFTTRLLELQFSWIYLASALGKWRGVTWRHGSALHYALALDHSFTRKLGAMVSGVSALVTPGTYAAMVVEGTFLFLTFSPVFRRTTRIIGILLGTGLHAGIALTMRVGNFSHLMVACYPLFLAPEQAERFVHFCQERVERGALARFARSLGERRVLTKAWPRELRVVCRTALLGILAAAVWLSCPRFPGVRMPPEPAWVQNGVQLLEVAQSWDMFAPDPAPADFYLTGEGVLKDGTKVDVVRGLNGGPLPPVEPRFFFTRWTKFLANLTYAKPPELLPFGNFLCRRWNSRAGGQSLLMTFKLFRQERVTSPMRMPPAPWRSTLLWDHHCF